MKYKLSFIFCFIIAAAFSADGCFCSDIYSKAKILKIENAETGKNVSIQNVRLKITGGKYKGMAFDVKNYLWSDKHYNTYPGLNDTVVARIQENAAGGPGYVSIYCYPRDNLLLSLMLIFFAAVFLICGKKGFGLSFSIIVNVFIFWRLLIPMLKSGADPLFVCALSAFASAAVMLFSILGFTKKFLSALFCVASGILFSGLMTMIFIRWAGVSGAFIDGSRMLLTATRMMNDWHITDFRGLAAGGVMIAALGTVIDVVVDVVAGMNSVRGAVLGITRKELFSAGMEIGRDVLGGMLGSLLLVFAAMSLVSLILYSALHIPFLRVTNWEFFTVTVLQTFISSMSFVVSVPIAVAVTAATLCGRTNE